MQKSNQAIYSILAMLTIWVVIHTVKLNTIVPDYSNLKLNVDVLIERLNSIENTIDEAKEIELTPFGETFNQMREVWGEGHTFMWGGRPYTTYYAEEVNYNNK